MIRFTHDLNKGFYSTKGLSYNKETDTLTGELSSLCLGKPIDLVRHYYNTYITLVSHLTGGEEMFVLDNLEHDSDGSVTVLNFTGRNAGRKTHKLVLFND